LDGDLKPLLSVFGVRSEDNSTQLFNNLVGSDPVKIAEHNDVNPVLREASDAATKAADTAIVLIGQAPGDATAEPAITEIVFDRREYFLQGLCLNETI